MTKKIAVIMLTICTSFCVYAEDISVSMDIGEGISYAMENSLTLKSSKANIEANRYTMISNRKTYQSYREIEMPATSFDTGLMLSGYYVDLTKMQYNISLREHEIKKSELKNDVESCFYEYYNCVEKEKLAQTNLDNIKEKAEFQKARLENGMISELDYELFNLSVKNAENALVSAKRNTELSLDKIKSTINFEGELLIKGEMPELNVEYVDYNEAITMSRTHNTYLAMAEGFDMSEKKWEYAKAYYFPNEYSYGVERYTFEAAQADYKRNLTAFDNGIKSTYFTLLELKDNLDYMEKYTEYLSRCKDVSYTKYEMGMITANQYVDDEQSYFGAKNDLMDLKLAYRTTALAYKSMYTK
ncbi:MAG: TolC family protein [Clostridia bacterium]|nr:TolC family protein [Clostridia bacterium]